MEEQNINNETQTEEIKDEKKERPEYKKKRVIVPAVLAILLLFTGIFAAIQSKYYQSTDDAFIEGHIIQMAPKVAGQIINLYVDDNQEVKDNQILAVIDPKDYQVKVDQADAKLAEARAKLIVNGKDVDQNYSNVDAANHELNAANSKLDFAEKDYTRYAAMYKEGIVSKQEYDNSLNQLTVAQANVKAAQEKSNAMMAAYESSKAKNKAVEAEIKRLEAELDQAKINLSYTIIKAPEAGTVSSRSVEKGNYVQVAQPLLSIVPKKVYVIANFKEIQLTNMKPGQKVTIKVDTYPHKRFKGKVDSIQRATGAKASLFPPENAVGSFVKIVQRVPVKIIFDEDISNYNIVPGMSVVPKVKIK